MGSCLSSCASIGGQVLPAQSSEVNLLKRFIISLKLLYI